MTMTSTLETFYVRRVVLTENRLTLLKMKDLGTRNRSSLEGLICKGSFCFQYLNCYGNHKKLVSMGTGYENGN